MERIKQQNIPTPHENHMYWFGDMVVRMCQLLASHSLQSSAPTLGSNPWEPKRRFLLLEESRLEFKQPLFSIATTYNTPNFSLFQSHPCLQLPRSPSILTYHLNIRSSTLRTFVTEPLRHPFTSMLYPGISHFSYICALTTHILSPFVIVVDSAIRIPPAEVYPVNLDDWKHSWSVDKTAAHGYIPVEGETWTVDWGSRRNQHHTLLFDKISTILLIAFPFV